MDVYLATLQAEKFRLLLAVQAFPVDGDVEVPFKGDGKRSLFG